jgi:hypothetical protein
MEHQNGGKGGEDKRLAVYGLDPRVLLEESLVIPPNTHVRLSGTEGKERFPGLVHLEPQTIDDVKQWIGVRNELGAKRACGCEMPAVVPAASSPAEFRRLKATDRQMIYDLAHEYVHGDSSRVAAYKPLIDHLIDKASIIGIFLRQDIDIYSGAVLEVAANVKILYARHIRIWKGGQLKLRGSVKIDCVSITGNLTHAVPAHVAQAHPIIGTLVPKEVAHG